VIDDPARDIVATLSTMKFARTLLSHGQIFIISLAQLLIIVNLLSTRWKKKKIQGESIKFAKYEFIDAYSTAINI